MTVLDRSHPSRSTPSTGASSSAAAVSDAASANASSPATLTGRGFVALCLAGLLGPFAFTAMTTATSSISATYGVSHALSGSVLVAYGAAFAATLLPGGRLGDALGRSLLLRVGLVVMLMASVLTAAAPTFELMLLGRVAQGCAAGLFFPQLLAVIQTSAPGARRLPMIARYTACLSLGTTGGQMLGGVLVAADIAGLGWRALPLLMAVIAAVALGVSHWVPRLRGDGRGLDGVGMALVVVGLGALLGGIGFVAARQADTDGLIVGGVVGALGLACLVALVVWERRREGLGRAVVLSTAALRVPAVGLGGAAIVVFYSAFTGFLVVWSAYAAALEGPATASVSFVVPGLVFLTVSLFMHHVVRHLGGRTPLFGAVVQGCALLVLLALVALGAPGGVWVLVPAVTLMTAANALMYGPLMPVVMNGVPAREAGMASGIFSTAQQVAMAVGSAVFAGVWAAVGGPERPGRAFGISLVGVVAACVVYGTLAALIRRTAERNTTS